MRKATPASATTAAIVPQREPHLLLIDPDLTFSELSERLHLSGLNPYLAANFISQFCITNFDDRDIVYNHIAGVWQLAAAQLASFCRFGIQPNAEPLSPLMSAKDLQDVILLAARFGSSAFSDADKDHRLNSAVRTMLRTVNMQSTLQGDLRTRLHLPLALMGILDPETGNLSKSSYLDPVFESQLGLTTHEYAAILFALWSSLRRRPIFDLDEYIQHASDASAWRRKFKAILDKISIPTTQIHDFVGRSIGACDGEAIAQVVLARKPIFEVSPRKYLSSPHQYLRFHATSNMFFSSLELARSHTLMQQTDPSDPSQNRFAEEMGLQFERLLCKAFSQLSGSGDLVSEFNFLRKGSAKSPDFIFLDHGDVILVQAKLAQMRDVAFRAASLSEIRIECSNRLVNSIHQSVKFLCRANDEIRRGRVSDTHRSIVEKIISSERIFLLGINAILPPLFSIQAFRRYLENGLHRKFTSNEADWWAANRHRIAGWHVTDYEEISAFVAAAPTESLHAYLTDYVKSKDFGFFGSRGAPMAFREYVIARSKPAKRKLANDGINRFMNSVVSDIFNKTIGRDAM